IGNGVSTVEALLSSKPQQREKELWELVRDVKRNIAEFCKKFPTKNREEWASLHKLHYKELMAKRMKPGDQTIYSSASWCNFPLYDVDFGWGKPIWTAVPQYPFQDGILLMDARDGVGVEAMVTLVKEEMAAFEQNEELLSFCQLKP
ncbi:MAG: acyltransferase, partial [Sweet potato little leaf phytoplasma]|nr:acyltransferase [Sweet potato little leaf phytoplasma]